MLTNKMRLFLVLAIVCSFVAIDAIKNSEFIYVPDDGDPIYVCWIIDNYECVPAEKSSDCNMLLQKYETRYACETVLDAVNNFKERAKETAMKIVRFFRKFLSVHLLNAKPILSGQFGGFNVLDQSN